MTTIVDSKVVPFSITSSLVEIKKYVKPHNIKLSTDKIKLLIEPYIKQFDKYTLPAIVFTVLDPLRPSIGNDSLRPLLNAGIGSHRILNSDYIISPMILYLYSELYVDIEYDIFEKAIEELTDKVKIPEYELLTTYLKLWYMKLRDTDDERAMSIRYCYRVTKKLHGRDAVEFNTLKLGIVDIIFNIIENSLDPNGIKQIPIRHRSKLRELIGKLNYLNLEYKSIKTIKELLIKYITYVTKLINAYDMDWKNNGILKERINELYKVLMEDMG